MFFSNFPIYNNNGSVSFLLLRKMVKWKSDCWNDFVFTATLNTTDQKTFVFVQIDICLSIKATLAGS